jgi:thioredoxin-related protein
MSLYLSNAASWLVIISILVFLYIYTKKINEFLTRFRFVDGVQIKPKIIPGEVSPAFSVKDHRNSKVELSSDKDYNVLLFVKNDCSICDKVMEEIEQLSKKNSHTRFILTGLEIERKISKYPMLMNVQNLHIIKDLALFQIFEVSQVPFLVVVDNSFTIQQTKVLTDENQVDELISFIPMAG